MMLPDDYFDVDPGVSGAAKHFDHATGGRAARDGRSRALDIDDVTVRSVQRIRPCDANLVEKPFLDWRYETLRFELHESSDDRLVGPLQNCFNPTLASAIVDAGHASDHRIAVQCRTHHLSLDEKVPVFFPRAAGRGKKTGDRPPSPSH